VRILYIGGYGRSGSTLLERILSGNPRFLATGELVNLPTVAARGQASCSCGEKLDACPLWGSVLGALNLNNPASLMRVERRLESLPRGLIAGMVPAWRRAYRSYQRALFEAIGAAAERDECLVIDSSKTAWKCALRPIALSRIAGLDLMMIHLVRDGRGCIWSNLRGSNRKLESGEEDVHVRFAALRTSASWLIANASALLGGMLLGRGRYMMLRYEALVEEPRDTLACVSRFTGVDLSAEIAALARGESVSLAHQVAGNRMRSERGLVLRPDVEWMSKLGCWRQALYFFVNWSLHLLFRRARKRR